jgi:hypothetical protein
MALLALGGSVGAGRAARRIAADDSCGFSETSPAPDELLTAVQLPRRPDAAWGYQSSSGSQRQGSSAWRLGGYCASQHGPCRCARCRRAGAGREQPGRGRRACRGRHRTARTCTPTASSGGTARMLTRRAWTTGRAGPGRPRGPPGRGSRWVTAAVGTTPSCSSSALVRHPFITPQSIWPCRVRVEGEMARPGSSPSGGPDEQSRGGQLSLTLDGVMQALPAR